MGMVYADITLRNDGDVTNVRRGIIKEPEIRKTAVTAIVDTGAATLVINEDVRQRLGLEIVGGYTATLADGSRQMYGKTETVQVQWKNRTSSCTAIVVPGADDVLLGAIPLEEMDLIISPSKQELTGAHGDQVLLIIKRLQTSIHAGLKAGSFAYGKTSPSP